VLQPVWSNTDRSLTVGVTRVTWDV